jgi:adenylate cyclase class 2
MAIETEIKYRLSKEQYERVEEDLTEFNANYSGDVFEENTIYSSKFLYDLKAILRIRKIGDKTILTFKKRISGNEGVKNQLEHETAVENGEEIVEIIENLGLRKNLIYEKRRKTWEIRGTEIMLDTLPFGLFLEIEGSAVSIREIEMILGTEDFQIEYRSYPNLTAELGKNNDGWVEARF